VLRLISFLFELLVSSVLLLILVGIRA